MPNANQQFWVYWVAAIGVVAFTAVVTWVLDRAINDEAEWTWKPIRYLKFWGDGTMKEKAIGFYNMRTRK
jgi:hypothetical protein